MIIEEIEVPTANQLHDGELLGKPVLPVLALGLFSPLLGAGMFLLHCITLTRLEADASSKKAARCARKASLVAAGVGLALSLGMNGLSPKALLLNGKLTEAVASIACAVHETADVEAPSGVSLR